jgi:hypothetical protein
VEKIVGGGMLLDKHTAATADIMQAILPDLAATSCRLAAAYAQYGIWQHRHLLLCLSSPFGNGNNNRKTMEIISMDSRVFDDLSSRLKTIEEKADTLNRNRADLKLKKWLDNEEVCTTLGISKRTLQSYREMGLLPFCRIKHKIFYKPSDVEKLLESSHHSTT